jgi:hypothetical protein
MQETPKHTHVVDERCLAEPALFENVTLESVLHHAEWVGSVGRANLVARASDPTVPKNFEQDSHGRPMSTNPKALALSITEKVFASLLVQIPGEQISALEPPTEFGHQPNLMLRRTLRVSPTRERSHKRRQMLAQDASALTLTIQKLRPPLDHVLSFSGHYRRRNSALYYAEHASDSMSNIFPHSGMRG